MLRGPRDEDLLTEVTDALTTNDTHFFRDRAPFAFLAASDHLARLPHKWLVGLSIPTVLHGVVLSMMRLPVWHREGSCRQN